MVKPVIIIGIIIIAKFLSFPAEFISTLFESLD